MLNTLCDVNEWVICFSLSRALPCFSLPIMPMIMKFCEALYCCTLFYFSFRRDEITVNCGNTMMIWHEYTLNKIQLKFHICQKRKLFLCSIALCSNTYGSCCASQSNNIKEKNLQIQFALRKKFRLNHFDVAKNRWLLLMLKMAWIILRLDEWSLTCDYMR